MTPARFAEIHQQRGEEATLTRPGGASVTVYAVRVGQPTVIELAGNAKADAIEVRISRAEIAAASWPEPPRNTDYITMAGRRWSIEGAQQLATGGTVYGWKLQVTGVP